MYLYKISQTKNMDYDTFDSAVVIARTADAAKLIHPKDLKDAEWWKPDPEGFKNWNVESWAFPEDVEAEYLGANSSKHKEGSVVCASFNAG